MTGADVENGSLTGVGANGTVTPLWATAGTTPFPAVGTSASPTTVVSLEMKTLPALAGVPVSRQAVVTVGPSTLSVECKVNTATGSADYSSLIAIPTG